jgi:hypothetical protein
MAKTEMTRRTRPRRPDYLAMAETLSRIVAELRARAAEEGSERDLEQAKRLERIAIDIRAQQET